MFVECRGSDERPPIRQPFWLLGQNPETESSAVLYREPNEAALLFLSEYKDSPDPRDLDAAA